MKNHCLLLLLGCLVVSGTVAQSGDLIENFLRENNLQAQAAPEGLRYITTQTGSGNEAKDGDYILIEYKAMLLDSTVFDRSEAGEPFVFQLGNREVIKGLDLGVRLIKKGGKATFFIPAPLGYQQYGIEGAVPPNSPLMYEVELLDVMDFEEYDRFMRNMEERERAEFEQRRKAQFETDLRLLEEYAAANQLRTKRTPSGLGYAITKPGKGALAKSGDHLKVSYEGYLANGEIFEASEKPFEFILGSARVIGGWEEGLQFFNKGSEGWLLVPSKLGYGPVAVREIPANSVLIFKIKILDIF